MKIRELRLKNLNSLYGEWKIDFTDRSYEDSGIFLISGPTGAGKTTVLDAICLALYGKTPRLAAINASGNEIMSRRTGDCYAEVVFETNQGLFLARWAQRRAQSKEDGNLQAQKREISEWNAEKEQFDLLETFTSRIDDVIAKKTGMNFGRFTRSMMLAQGQFAAFLQAKDDERSETLEQITGTEIYSRISRKVFERHKQEKERLNLMEKEVEGISCLSHDELFELEIQKAEKARQIDETQKKIDAIIAQQEWLRGIDRLKQEITENRKAAELHKKDFQAFEPQRKKLATAEKALRACAPFEVVKNTREMIAGDREKRKTAKDELKTAEKDLENRQREVNELARKQKAHEEAAVEEKKRIKEARELDRTITAEEQNLEKAKQKAESDGKEMQSLRTQLETAKAKSENDRKELQKHREYLSQNGRDESLPGILPVLQEQTRQWRRKQEDVEKQKAQLPAQQKLRKDQEEQLKTLQKQHKAAGNTLTDFSNQIKSHEEKLEALLEGRLLRELRKEQETLGEKLRLEEKILDLEAERKRLVAGDPCPLCGATDHPFADDGIPELSETSKQLEAVGQRLKQHEELTEARQSLVAKRDQQLLEQERIKGQINLCEGGIKNLAKELSAIEKEISSGEKEIQEIRAEIEKTTGAFEIDPEKDQVAELTRRAELWKKHEAEAKRLTDAGGGLRETMAALKGRLEEMEKAGAGLQEEIKKQNRNLLRLRSNRVQLFGDRNPDAEEERLEKQTRELAEAAKKAGEDLHSAKQSVAETNTRISDLTGRMQKAEPKLNEALQSFEKTISELGISSEEDFLSRILPDEEISVLKEQSTAHDRKSAQVAATETDLKNKLATEEARKLTKKSAASLEKQKEPLQQKNRELSERIGQLTEKLKHENENREKKLAKLTEYNSLKAGYAPWQELNRLIGSADGKRYRNFAQGLTFDVLIGHANQQLAKVTGRYLLLRDEDPSKALTLNVVDHFQGGEIRPVTNLSGGETFLVSLALALGLSQMAGNQVQVDSLFLDEGFGTLDDETLEEALDALANLKKEGKLIGVISHVPALKERLSVQLKVEQKQGGKSILTGPGVSVPESDTEDAEPALQVELAVEGK